MKLYTYVMQKIHCIQIESHFVTMDQGELSILNINKL